MDDHLHWWPVIPLSLVYGLTSPQSLAPGNSLLTAVWDNNGLFNLGSSVDLWNTDCLAATAHPALLSPTHQVQFHRVQHQGCQTGWTPGTYDYNLSLGIISDHRSNPISCLFLEFSKVDMRANVFWIPVKSIVFPLMDTHKIICTQYQQIHGDFL